MQELTNWPIVMSLLRGHRIGLYAAEVWETWKEGLSQLSAFLSHTAVGPVFIIVYERYAVGLCICLGFFL